MSRSSEESTRGRSREAWAMALVFGLLAVAWTYGFEQVGGLPLWPSFVASASLFAAGGGPRGFVQSLAGNVLGGFYAALTLAIVAGLGGGVVELSLVVGGFMLLASLHALVGALAFTPAAFFGYAAVFGVHASGTSLALAGTGGELVATLASMAIGAALGLLAEALADRLAEASPG